MKKILLTLTLLWAANLQAQKEKVIVETNERGTLVKVGRSENISIQEADGATRIRLGSTAIDIAEDNVHIDFWKKHERNGFRGHWAGVEIGINGYAKENYDAYALKDFMDLRPTKSTTINFNLLQFDFGLQKDKNTVGILTGLGFESRDYRFENNFTLQNVNGTTQGVPLTYNELKKSKLNILYATIPLIFEMQLPDKKKRRFHLGVGLEGGWRIGSHTKIKYKEDGKWKKSKDRNNFNLNDFKVDAQLRLGYGGLHMFVAYGLVDLFQKDKGPELTPITVGITLLSF